MRDRGAALPLVVVTLLAALLVTACTVRVPGSATPDPAAFAPSPATPTLPTTTGPFVDARGRFALVPPPGWTVDTGGVEGTAVVFADPRPAGPAGRPFRANVNVLVVPSVGDLSATVARSREELTGLPGHRPTADEPFTLADGTPAHVLGGTFDAPGSGSELRNEQVLAVHAGSTVVATGTAPAEEWDTYGPVFDTALRSLTVAG